MGKILVSGGAGYIGAQTVLELERAGYHTLVMDDFSNSSPLVLQRLADLLGYQVEFVESQIQDLAKLEGVFSHNQIDAVIHFAGFKAVGESVAEPLKYYDNNLISAISLLKMMKKYDCKNFIFSSSATVYGASEKMPLTEDMPLGPCTNPYGWTKLMIEQILRDVAFAHPQLSVCLLRYFNPIGADASGMIGEDPNGIPNNLMPYISQVAVGKLAELSVYGNDYPTVDGTGVRDYIHVVDLALGHIKALEYAAEHTGVAAFNLGTGKGTSVLELLHTFEKVNNLHVKYKIVGRRPGDPATVYADASKAEKILHWKAERNIEDMCRDTWNWQSKNPNGYQA